MKRFLSQNNSFLWLTVFVFLLVIALHSYYLSGYLILGGEGNNFLDFSLYLNNFKNSWLNYGTGLFATSLNITFAVPFFFALLQKFITNYQTINFLVIFLIYYLPFLGMLGVSRQLKLPLPLSFLMALFYILNPFSIRLLASLNQWNLTSLFIIPAFFWLILKFYHHNFRLLFLFGLLSLFFAYFNTNPPLLVISQISILISVVIVSYYLEKKRRLKKIITKYLLVFPSFLLFNFWWILNWFYILPDAQQGYTKELAISWLRGQQVFIPAFWRVLNFKNLLSYPPRSDYDFLNNYFSGRHTLIFLSFPVFLILYFLLRKARKPSIFYLLGLFWIIIGFLTKGVNGLFGQVYEFLVYHLPFFHIFKTAEEKWGLLFVFLTTLLMIVILKEIKKEKAFRYFSVFLLASVAFFLYPFLTGNFIPDYKYNEEIYGSRKFIDKIEYQKLREKLNNDPEQFRVLSLPGSWNYQIALQIEGNKFYTGNDPILSNTNKPFLTPYSGSWTQTFGVLYDKISHPDYLKILGLYNLKKIVINKDMYPWFGFREKESVMELEEIFDQKFTGEKNEAIDFYDIGDNFLPRFYVPDQIIYSPESTQYELPELVSLNNTSKRTALFISPYEKIKEEDKFENDLVKEKANQIMLVGELLSGVDEAKLRAGIRGMNPGGVLFPYARWKPGGLIYPYVLKKEGKRKNQFLNQPEELLEQNLFFAGKRVYEIQKWDRGLSDKDFLAVLERYEKEINEAIINLEEIRKTGKDTFFLLAKIAVSLEAFEERLLGVIEGDFGRDSQRFNLVQETIARTDKTLKSILEHYYYQARYYFEVPEEGEYEVLLERKEEISDWKIENITPNEEERFNLGIADKQEEKNWLSFGKQNFEAKEYVLVLDQTPPLNLLEGNWDTFRGGIWIEGKTIFFGKEGTPTTWQEVKNWEPESTYKLSFKYKITSGKLKIFVIEEKEKVDTFWFDKGVIDEPPDKADILLAEELISKDSPEWEEYNIVVYSGRNAKPAKIFITSESEEMESVEIEFKEATLTKIIEPNMVLKKDRNEDYFEAPQITFQKINPTKYLLEIANANQPYFLVFSESFHRGWKAYLKEKTNSKETNPIIASYFNGEINERNQASGWFDKNFYETWGKESLPEESHLLMNGYANAWYLTPEDTNNQVNYQIIIEYWPQRLFYLGVGVTLATIIISLGFGLWRSNKFNLFKDVKKS